MKTPSVKGGIVVHGYCPPAVHRTKILPERGFAVSSLGTEASSLASFTENDYGWY